MKDTELYNQILGLTPPWKVDKVSLEIDQHKVNVWVTHPKNYRWQCPKCQSICPLHDHSPERTWRHLDTCQLQTYLHSRIPRIKCQEHGVMQVDVPWSVKKSRFTLLMERFVIDVLNECATVSGACRILRLSWDEVFGIMQRSVERGLSRKLSRSIDYLGVDEKAFKKGHSYMTIVCDAESGNVEYVAEGRSKDSLSQYWQSLKEQQLSDVKAVCMDMLPAYFSATMENLPNAKDKIVYDRFHIMKYVNTALNQVQKKEHRELIREGSDALKGTKMMWQYAEENLPEKYHNQFSELKQAKLKTARAWALKESIRELWQYHYPGNARKFFKDWYYWATHSQLKPMITVAKQIKERLENIITFCKHRITNGVAEGLNSKIMSIKRRACGYRNKENFKLAIYFFCGGLALYP